MSDITDNLDDYSNDAKNQFLSARSTVNAPFPPNPLPDPPAPPSDADKPKLDYARGKVQEANGKLNNAIKQMVFASQTISDEERRIGFSSVMQLMQATATTADAVCTKLQSEVGNLSTTVDIDQEWRISRLVSILQGLAAISPADVWKTAPPAAE